jgi:serine/threonine protein kinase
MTYIYNDGSIVNLDAKHKFASGGEGAVYMHPSKKNKCIKIYHTPKSKTLTTTYAELNQLDGAYFVKPEEILFTKQGDLGGFEMKYVDLSKYFIFKKLTVKSFCDQNGYDRKFKFKVYEALKKCLNDAHSKNIVIGDLNPYNIFVNDKAEVLFVDVDSYATKNKKHSGVLLEDIRDYVLHPNINQKTDTFAFDILIYWMFTYLHPYRGNSKSYKNLEERMVKKASVLANIPDLILPAVYEKFTNQHILDQFVEIFQKGARFIVDLAATGVIPQNIPAFQPLNLSSKELYIRLLDEDIIDIFCSNNILVLKTKNGDFKVFNVSNYGNYNQIERVVADEVFVGSKNYLSRKGTKVFYKNVEVKNYNLPPNCKTFVTNNTLFVIDLDNNIGTKVVIDNIINNNVQQIGTTMYAPSIQINDAIMQFVGDSNWFFIPNGTNHNTVRTHLNIKNAYQRNGIFCVEHIENNKIKYGLYKINGTQLEFIFELSDFSYFDVLGDFIFVPSDGKINLISILRKEIVMTIDCPISKTDSKLYQTNGGMIIFTNNRVFFINKK